MPKYIMMNYHLRKVRCDDEEVPPLIGKKKRKRVEKLLERTIFVFVDYLEDVQVGYLFLNKKYLTKKLAVFAIM